MKDAKKGITFPYLIHRDDVEIENDITFLREQYKETSKRLNDLFRDLCRWKGSQIKVIEFFDYLLEGDHERQLLEMFRESNNLPEQVKTEKIKEIYQVPDYSSIINKSKAFQNYNGGIELFFHGKDQEIRPPQISESEKESIVKKHSYYVSNEESLLMFTAVKHICAALNILNFDLHTTINSNKIPIGRIRQALPEVAKFLKAETVEEGSVKRSFVVNYAAF